MSLSHKFQVEIQFLPATEKYLATSPDIPGLVLEADTLDDLWIEAKTEIPYLLYHNCGMRPGDEIVVYLSRTDPQIAAQDTLTPKWVLDQEMAAAV